MDAVEVAAAAHTHTPVHLQATAAAHAEKTGGAVTPKEAGTHVNG